MSSSMAPRLSLYSALSAVLLLVAQHQHAHAFSFFGSSPTIDGDSLSWDGDGKTFNPSKAFEDDDKYTQVTLVNWKMDAASNLSIPATVKTLTLVNCHLAFFPDEIRNLANLESLNMAYNQLTSADGAFASAATIKTFNVTNNNIANFSVAFPAVSTLDLSSNMLTSFPSSIFKSPLTSFYINDNGFKLASVSSEQFDFFAGLSNFQADFAESTSCGDDGELVNLKGNKICRVKVANPVNPTVLPHATNKSDSSGSAAAAAAFAGDVATPIPTVGVVIIQPSGTSDSTYILSGLIGLLLVAVVGAGVFALIMRRQTAKLRGKLHEDTPLFFDSEKRANYERELHAGDKLFPSNDQVLVTWRVDYDSVKLTKKIAKGAFGEVWIGRYRGSKVAVKKLLESQGSFEASEDFVREIKLMAWLQHPKIVQFIGVAWTRLIDMLAVIEYMDNGDLRTLLDSDRTMKWEDRKLQYALDTIDAIVYLHSLSPVIIHRDLKSRNILIDTKKGAKLGDFGISAAKRDQDMTTGVGTTRWLAPELARGEIQYTEAVDIYSFGVILSELDTHELPFYDAKSKDTGEKLPDFSILQGVASGELAVSFSPNCPPKLLELARRCISVDPKQRPAAAEVAYQLRQRDLLLA